MKTRLLKVLAMSAVLGSGIPTFSQAAECIAPANPGGGWDFTCRQIGKIMFDIGAVDKPIRVTNMAGAGGGLAYNHVVAERNDDADLIGAASSATSTRLAQNAYAGVTADRVRLVGAIGAPVPVTSQRQSDTNTQIKDRSNTIYGREYRHRDNPYNQCNIDTHVE